MSWLRLDDGFPQHPKIAALTDRQFRDWLTLLAYCARYKTGGEVPEGSLRVLGVRSASVAAFQELGLLEDLTVHDWEKYNPADPTNAERQARHRTRKRNAPRNGESNASHAGGQARAVPSPTRTSTTSSEVVRERDLLWDALNDEIGEAQTKTERSRRGKCVAELREADVTPAEVHERCERWRHGWPDMTLTDTALVKHWTTLAVLEPPKHRKRNGGLTAEDVLNQALDERRREEGQNGAIGG